MASIQGIYIALFGRPADPAGLAYFNGATHDGADLTAIGDLAQTDEYQTRFAGMTNEEIVNSIYKSLFDRDAEADGLKFFVGELEAGRLNINNIAIAILDGAQNDDLLAVNNKIAAADLFTSHLDLQIEVDAYRGTFAAQVGREFIATIHTDHPGTGADADTAILRLFPDQGQEPGTGGGGGGGGPQPTFIIYDGEGGISFGGTAKGDITLGQKPGGAVPEVLTLARVSESTILTGERGHIQATFDPKGATVSTTDGVHIASLDSLKPADSLKLADGLHVSLTAATADHHAIGGDGSVCVSGSEGDQTIIVSATGGNHIEGGLGADTIDITDATGNDTIEVHGVASSLIETAHAAENAIETHNGEHEQLLQEQTVAHEALSEAQAELPDETVFQEQTDAQSAFDGIGGEAGLATLDQAAVDAAALLEERNTLQATANQKHDAQTQAYQGEATAENAYNNAVNHNTAVSAYNATTYSSNLVAGFIAGVPDNAAFGAGRTTSNINIDNAKTAINFLSVDQALKDQLIAALPAKSQGNSTPLFNDASERDAYKAAAAAIINSYKASVAGEVTTTLNALTDAKEHADIAHDAYVGAKNALDQHVLAHPGDLQQALTDANAAAQDGHDKLDALTHANEAADARHALIDAADHADAAVADSNTHGQELQAAFDHAKADVAGTQHDSMLGHEDHVIGFQKDIDTLLLPTKFHIVHDIHELTAHYDDKTYHIDITNGIATVTAGDDPTPIKLGGDVLKATLDFLSNDNNVHQGETIAFAYADENNPADHGLYVFQGGDFGTDIGVKLVGVSIGEAGVTSLGQILPHPV